MEGITCGWGLQESVRKYESGESDRDRRLHTKLVVGTTNPEGMTRTENSKIEKRLQEKISEDAQRPTKTIWIEIRRYRDTHTCQTVRGGIQDSDREILNRRVK